MAARLELLNEENELRWRSDALTRFVTPHPSLHVWSRIYGRASFLLVD